jgi:hypothetical protein
MYSKILSASGAAGLRKKSKLAFRQLAYFLFYAPNMRITEQLIKKKTEHHDGLLQDLEEISLHQLEIEKIEVIGCVTVVQVMSRHSSFSPSASLFRARAPLLVLKLNVPEDSDSLFAEQHYRADGELESSERPALPESRAEQHQGDRGPQRVRVSQQA